MPKIRYFDNKEVVEPGAYVETKGGDKQAPDVASFGNVMIIDTGTGASFGGGSGINGTKYKGMDSIYEADDIDAFRDWQRGGLLWDVVYKLFNPSRDPAVKGCDKLWIVRANTTAPGTIAYTFVGGGANGGTLDIKTIAEGLGANGVEHGTTNELITGFAGKMIAGVEDTSKYIIQFYVGIYKGLDANGIPFDEIDSADVVAKLLVQSAEFDNIADVISWMNTDYTFNQHFYLSASTVAGDGSVDAADLVANTGNELAATATETYNAADLDTVLDNIPEVDNTFFLCDKYGISDGKDTENGKILAHVITEAVDDKFLVIGGGKDATEFDQSGASSIDLAQYYDTSRVYVVHSDILKAVTTGDGFKRYTSFYHAAAFCGRIAGLQPQDPATWKDIDIDGVAHKMNIKDRKKGLKNGVIHIRVKDGDFIVNQEVNTLQKNQQTVYPDGQSPEGSVMRIDALLAKEIRVNLENMSVGKNANTSSPAKVKSKVEDVLLSRTASKDEDNLILGKRDIKVSLVGTDYEIGYGYTTNTPINRLFITQTIFSPKITV